MATSEPRQVLLWEIHKKLPLLSASQLYQLAATLVENEDSSELAEKSEPQLYYFISDYLKSDKLMNLEDEGMSHLLSFQDKINELLASKDSSGQPDGKQGRVKEATRGTAAQEAAASNTSPQTDYAVQTTLTAPHVYSEGCVTTNRLNAQSNMSDQWVKLTDVAAFLPRREFKIQGGQISDIGSEISYAHICKQIDEGVHDGFTESEIMRAIIKVTKGGTFKDLLTDKDDMTITELKRFLRSHIMDKSAAELFQELSNAKQQDKETPQQFLYKIMGLRQRVMRASQQNGAEFHYDKRLVQGVFLHTLYQGLNERHSNIRQDLKPYVSDPQVTDDVLLEQLTKSACIEAERTKRFSSVAKARPVTVNVTQHVEGEQGSQRNQQTLVNSEIEANRTAIMQLTAQVSALIKSMEDLSKPGMSGPTSTQSGKFTKSKCRECTQQKLEKCFHCFRCGQIGHRAVGCLNRAKSGNQVRSRERDDQ